MSQGRSRRVVGTAIVAFLASAAGQAAEPTRARATPAGELRAVSRLVESGELDAAEARLRKLLAAQDGAAARTLLGVVLMQRGRLPEAEKELRRAARLDPNRSGPHQGLARVLEGQGRSAEAASELRTAARLGPLDLDLALRLAEIEIAAGHRAAAERQLRSAAERYDSVRALLSLSRLLSSSGDAAGSRGALEQARARAPNSEELLQACAQSWLESKKPEQALAPLEALVRIHPGVAEYRYLRGVALLQTADAKGALSELSEANRLEPKRALTLIAMGAAQNRLLRFADAAASLQEGLALEPDSLEGMAELARAEEGEGKFEEASSHLGRVLARNPDHGLANLVSGTLLMKSGDYREAREALERAVAAEPTVKAHYQLSLAYARLGDETRAREQRALLEQAVRQEEERQKALGRVGGMGGRGGLE